MPTNKRVQRLAEKTQAVEYALRRNRNRTLSALGEKFPTTADDVPASELLAEETLRSLEVPTGPIPDWEVLQGFIERELEVARLRLRQAEIALNQELQDDPITLKHRDEVVEEVYRQVLHVRHVLDHSIGEEEAYKLLGIDGATPKRPPELLAHMRAAIVQLRNPQRVPEHLGIYGMTMSWADLAAGLERDAERLAEAIDGYREEEKDAQLARLDKDNVMVSVNDTYVGLSRVLEGLYIAAGLRRLAENMRLAVPSSSSRSNEDEPEIVIDPPPDSPRPPEPPGNGEGPPFPVAAVNLTGADLRPIVALPPDALNGSGEND